MPRVDFLITNDGHHSAMFLPVIQAVAAAGVQPRAVSLCELRGLPSPAARYAELGVPLVRVVPPGLRRSPATGRQSGGGRAALLRAAARRLVWWGGLGRSLERAFRGADLAVLPNDGGFPYRELCGLLRRRRVPILVVQEGIRFRQPHATDQGQGGADAVAVWGETSAAYYRRQGTPPERIHVTGNPRMEDLEPDAAPEEEEALRRRLDLRQRTLLLLSNPIEDLGFGSTRDKLALVRSFGERLSELLAEPGFRWVIKLHRRESPADFETALADLPHRHRIRVVGEAPLYPLLRLSSAAVVMASSAGLEALLLDRPLAVLEIPGFGFAHDFVSSGAAVGLGAADEVAAPLRRLMHQGHQDPPAVERYLAATVRGGGRSTERIASLIRELLDVPNRPGRARP